MKNLTLLLCFCATAWLGAQDLSEGLVIHYPFEGDLTDAVSGETAENNGNLTFQDGRIGSQAVMFFNQDAYFVTPEGALQVGPSADGGTPGTFALWVNHRGATLDTERHNYIAQKNGCGPEDNNRGRVVMYRQGPNTTPGPDSLTSFISGRRLLSNFGITEGDTWIHLLLTVEPDTREWAFYVNGVENKRDTFPGSAQAENSCGEFVIGHHLTFTTESQTFDGLMDDLRFYNRVLTQEEINLLAERDPDAVREVVVDGAMRIAPNPLTSGQQVQLEVDRSVFPPSLPLEVRVHDLAGRQVLNRTYTTPAGRLFLEQQLTPGVYVVNLTDGGRVASTRLVVR